MSEPRKRVSWACIALAALVAGCSARARDEAVVSRQALTSSNGLWANGLTTNGLWANGLWANGLWANGLWANGLWANGLWANGLWANGLWANGLWANGLWANGLWANGLWANGLTGAAAVPGDTLRNSVNARQLLQYIYSCAMPPTIRDTTLDPNGGALLCSPGAGGADAGGTCDAGYTCSAQGTCVIPLIGGVGLGINDDGTTWWGDPAPGGAAAGTGTKWGECDETCQRWVSACVLARTNAYGVHVEISMRAPADAPPAIRNALAVSALERNGDDAGAPAYSLREGAYFGNLFATAPLNPAPSPTYSGPTDGPIAQTPSFYACAGPGSNIPEVTKRFCSSQGDQVVIAVPGICLGATLPNGVPELGVCAGEDTDPQSQTFGAIQDCSTSTATQPPAPCATGTDPSCYNEVITVYLKQLMSVCGNAVCESAEDPTSGASDCHPDSWAKDLPRLNTFADVLMDDAPSFNAESTDFGVFALGPQDSVVVVGMPGAADPIEVDFGGGPIPWIEGEGGILAKYAADGSYVWARRIGSTDDLSSAGASIEQRGIIVGPNGNTTVVGMGSGRTGANLNVPTWIISTATFDSDGNQVAAWGLTVGDETTTPQSFSLDVSNILALDSQGNLIMAGGYGGVGTFGSFHFTSTGYDPSSAFFPTDDVYLAKVTPQGTVVWAQSMGGAGFDYPISVSVDAADNILFLASFDNVKTLQRYAPDGTPIWPTPMTAAPGAVFSAAMADAGGDVYLGGRLYYGADLGGGPVKVQGPAPFLAKYDPAGVYQWASHASPVFPSSYPVPVQGAVVIPPPLSPSVISLAPLEVARLTRDPAGNIVVASFGNTYAGGGVDFGVGTFPTYQSNNIFLSAYAPDDGHLLWAKQVPTVLSSNILGLAVDSSGRVVVGGAYAGSMQVDNHMLATQMPEAQRLDDMFVASFGAPSPLDTTPPEIGAGLDPTGAPLFTIPNDIYTEATSPSGANVFYTLPTALDSGDAGTQVACKPSPNTAFYFGTTTVTCTAADPRGNQSSATFKVTVVDTVAPVFGPTPDVTVQATDGSGAPVQYSVTATDQVAGARPVTCTAASGSVFPVGATKVTCTASDNWLNQAQASFTVTVTPPPVSARCVGAPGAPVTVSTAPGTCSAILDASDAGSCGGTPTSCTFDGASSEVLGPGDHAVAVLATAPGATAGCSSYVRVVDGEPPVVTCSSPRVECSGNGIATVTPTATCTDNCGCTATCAPGFFPVGSSPAACAATDAAGNTSSCQATVTVVDTTAPVVTPRPGSSQLQCHVDPWVDPGASASDVCVGDLSGAVTTSGHVDPMHVGAYLETYSVQDPSGNVGSAKRMVTVVDTLPPATTATVSPSPSADRTITINITSYSVTPKGGGAAITGSAQCWTTPGVSVALSASDACALKGVTYALAGAQAGGASVAGGRATVVVNKAGTTTLTYYATDAAGNAEVARTLPLFVGRAAAGFGFSCAPAPSLRAWPAHGTATAKGTVTTTVGGKQVTQPFSFSASY